MKDRKEGGAVKQITLLEEIEDAAKAKRALVLQYPGMKQRMPAAFVMSMQASQVLRMIRRGMWIYEKEATK